MLRRIDATVVFVRDLERCMAFYRDTLGFVLKESDPDSASFALGDQYFLLLRSQPRQACLARGPT